MNKYDDLINLPHHQSKRRPHMSLYDRAAQFSPFAALTGYDDVVKETARLTDKKTELSEETKSELSAKLTLLQEKIKDDPSVLITYFVPDKKKSGGTYRTLAGIVKRIDEIERFVVMKDGTKIPIDDISAIAGDLWDPAL